MRSQAVLALLVLTPSAPWALAQNPLSYRTMLSMAEQGDVDAQAYLGLMYAEGKGVPEDDAEAVKWFLKAAEQGNAYAQYNLGFMYAEGEGVPEDDAEAVKWYRKAAEQGNVDAQHKLGFIYAKGEGVPKDDAEAVKWFRKAAEQDYPWAQAYLGFMYAEGKGVPENDAAAVKWYRKAAEQGDASGQFNLGLMYANGEGVPEDYVRGYAWLNLATAKGDEKAVEIKDELRLYMTAEQIARAQELSASLFKSINESQPIPHFVQRYNTEEKETPPQNAQAPIIRVPVANTDRGMYAGVGGGHWIDKNIDSGAYMILEDGSLWQIDPIERIDAMLWLPISQITVLESASGAPGYNYLLINTNDGEKAHAKYLGQQ